MSLLIASCVNDSVIIAYDAFVLNNDTNELIKRLDFQKTYFCPKRRSVFSFVGSRYVFNCFCEWLAENNCSNNNDYIEKWSELDKSFGNTENQENALYKHKANSILFFVNQNKISEINIISDRKQYSTNSYIAIGSGSQEVEENLKKLSVAKDLKKHLSLIIDCFMVAQINLFVSGIPQLMIIKSDGIKQINDIEEIYLSSQKYFYKSLKKSVYSIL